MDQKYAKQDYVDAIQKLHYQVAIFRKIAKFLILFKLVDEDTREPFLILRVYNGDFMWMQQVDRKLIDDMRKKSEVQGTYTSFCDMLKQSLETQQFELVQIELNMKIVFSFKLSRDVFLKGILEMGGGMPILNDDDTRKIQSEFTFDLYEAMKNTSIPTVVQQSEKKQFAPQLLQDFVDVQNDLRRRRVNADIIMPNMKKRRVQGAKLG